LLRKYRFDSLSIRTKVFIALLSGSFLLFSILGIVGYHHNKNMFERSIKDHLISVAEIQKHRIEEFAVSSRERINLVTSRTQLRINLKKYLSDPEERYLEEIYRFINDAKKASKDFVRIDVVSLNGDVLVSTSPDRVGKITKDLPKNREELREIKFPVQLIKDPKDNSLLMETHGPLLLDGELIGAVCLLSKASQLTKIVDDQTGLGASGETILADYGDNGARFLTPLRFDRESILNRFVDYNRSRSPIIKAFRGEKGFSLNYCDYRNIPIYSVTDFIPELNWGMVVKMDQSEAERQLLDIQLKLFETVLLMVPVIFLFSIFVSRFIGSPILRLTETAKKIRDGDYSSSADDSSKDEIGVLGKAFNQMTVELISTKRNLEEAQRISKIGSWELDLIENRFYWSDEIYEIFEVDRERTKPTYGQFLEIIYPEDRELVNQTYTTSLRKRDICNMDHRLLLKDGRVKYVNSHCETIFNEDNLPLKSYGTVQDISERKELELQLIEQKESAEVANRAKSHFLANISHEIRTPMNSIIGFTDASLKSEISNEVRRYIEKIDLSAKRLLTLVNDILDLSKLEQDKFEHQNICFYLPNLLKDISDKFREKAEQKGLSLSLNSSEDLNSCFSGDPHRIGQVLSNLLDNGIKFTETGGVEIAVEEREGVIYFQIIDTGIGIDEKFLETIFDCFTQADGSSTRKFGGTGLGVTISKRIVQKMGGKIWAESRVGVGSNFHFTLNLEKLECKDNCLYSETITYISPEQGEDSKALLEKREALDLEKTLLEIESGITMLQRGEINENFFSKLTDELSGSIEKESLKRFETAIDIYNFRDGIKRLEDIVSILKKR
jgi:PAS domain S-box-containing protein